VGVGTGVAFFLLYLYSIGNILIVPGADLALGTAVPAFSVVFDWATKIWKPVAPFLWEPIVALYPIRSVALFISVPNLLLALLLGTLVALNLAIAIARARLMVTVKKGRGFARGFLVSLPAVLTGFTCCVPTIVLALGSLAAGLTVTAIALAPYFLPVAAFALLANLIWGLRQFSCAPLAASSQNRVTDLIHKRNKERRHNHAF
jgi:hypothetical protein